MACTIFRVTTREHAHKKVNARIHTKPKATANVSTQMLPECRLNTAYVADGSQVGRQRLCSPVAHIESQSRKTIVPRFTGRLQF